MSEPGRIRLLSYNIWNYSGGWGRRRYLLADTIAATRADIVALQEVRHNWNDPPGHNQAWWLGQRLAMEWAYRPANMFVPIPPVTEGLGFLSRGQFADLRWIPVPKKGRGPRRIILRTRIDRLNVYNVHFPLSEEGRVIEAETILSAIARDTSAAAVVLGDFNADADDRPMRLLFEAGFVDLWAQLPGPNGSIAKRWPDQRRIDYVLARGIPIHDGTIQVVGASAVDGVRPSDHLGILVDLAWTSPRQTSSS